MKGVYFSDIFRIMKINIPILLISHGYYPHINKAIEKIPNTFYAAKDPSLLPLAAQTILQNKTLDNHHPLIKNWKKRNDFYQLSKYDEMPPEQILSDFEKTIIRFMGEDLTVKEMAERLKTSKSTITHTKTDLVRRLKLPRSGALILYGIAYGHIPMRAF